MMEEAQSRDIIVNKSLYIGHEQQPIYKIFNEKINRMPRTGPTRESQKPYSKDNERT